MICRECSVRPCAPLIATDVLQGGDAPRCSSGSVDMNAKPGPEDMVFGDLICGKCSDGSEAKVHVLSSPKEMTAE